MRFAKGHGTGNDFIIVPDADDQLELCAELIRRLCDRHAGLGADGVLRVVSTAALGPEACGPETGAAQWFMDYRNSDGSVAEMCGNGIRVFARYLIDHRLAAGPELAVATRAGLRLVRRQADGMFRVDMGPATVRGTGVAVVGGRRCEGLAVWVGNPHLACLVTGPVAEFDLTAPPEVDPGQFPDGVNVELLHVVGERAIEMRVHERGSGETMSCGTGAVAAAVAAAAAAGEWPGSRSRQWEVVVPGGRLTITPSATASLLTGPAVIVAEGCLDEAWLAGSDLAVAASLTA
ncbi:MAG TPA: diaminopimelate epimerase [Streptosporangiaceae bacterium]|nr:diaminopimelate epimerase [Streptosporangiaceae bacterium]